MSALTEQISEVLEQHRPYGLDCKCGEAINSDAWWAAHVAERVAEALADAESPSCGCRLRTRFLREEQS